MLICLLVQAILSVVLIRYYTGKVEHVEHFSFVTCLAIIYGVLMLLITGAIIQIGIWAVFYFALNEFSSFSPAFYHSAVNFSTLGYGDIVMSDRYKLLGPLQALNGVIMIGLSTSALTLVFKEIIKKAISNKRSLRS